MSRRKNFWSVRSVLGCCCGILLALACVSSVPAWAGADAPTITFVPAHPTSSDSIVAYLSVVDCGQTTSFVVTGAQITVTTGASGGCGTPPPVTMVTLGVLPAGTYQVQWFEQQQLAASAQLVIAAAVTDPTPLLQPWALLLLAAACGALAFAKLPRRASS